MMMMICCSGFKEVELFLKFAASGFDICMFCKNFKFNFHVRFATLAQRAQTSSGAQPLLLLSGADSALLKTVKEMLTQLSSHLVHLQFASMQNIN